MVFFMKKFKISSLVDIKTKFKSLQNKLIIRSQIKVEF